MTEDTAKYGKRYSDGLLAKQRYYLNNKEQIRKRTKEYYRVNPLVQLLRNAKSRSKKRGWDFTIEINDLVIPDKCPILNIPLVTATGYGLGNSPSLDRIDNSLGYIKGNVRVISNRANRLKCDMTVEECECILNDLKSIRKVK